MYLYMNGKHTIIFSYGIIIGITKQTWKSKYLRNIHT